MSGLRRWPGLVAVVALLTGCGAAGTRGDHPFWLTAAPDPILQIVPQPLIEGDELVEMNATATVVGHASVQNVDIEHLLVVRTTEGKVWELGYRLGGKRRIPVVTGERLRIAFFARQIRAADDEREHEERGVIIYAFRRPAGAGPEAREREVPIAVVDTGEVVPPSRLPLLLRLLAPTRRAAYHERVAWSETCSVTFVHAFARLRNTRWIVPPTQPALSPLRGELMPPGGRITLAARGQRFDLMLLDNRLPMPSTCAQPPTSLWAWAAVWAQTPTDEQAAPGKQTTPSEQTTPSKATATRPDGAPGSAPR